MNDGAKPNLGTKPPKTKPSKKQLHLKNIITKQLKKLTLVLSFSAALFAATAAKAASFDLWVTV